MSPLKTEVLLCHPNLFSPLVSFLSILAKYLLSTPIIWHIFFQTIPHLLFFSPPYHLQTPMSLPKISKPFHNFLFLYIPVVFCCLLFSKGSLLRVSVWLKNIYFFYFQSCLNFPAVSDTETTSNHHIRCRKH